jgi:hydroxymethylpyrimidine pyrophosphatase-like HAD family hydrolase
MLYKHLTYDPMVELVTYLQESDFTVFIVTGGEIDFVRSVSEEIYNIPPEMVVGSNVKYEYVSNNDGVELIRTKELNSANDKYVKPPNIQLHIGKKPIFAAGNSDGDYEMMEYTLSGNGPAMAILVHHDDAEREYVYMHGTEKAIEDAKAQGWYVVSIKEDFKEVFGKN